MLRDDLNGAITFLISDVDEDGDKDIIVAELDGNKVAYLSNNGSESFTNTTKWNHNSNQVELKRVAICHSLGSHLIDKQVLHSATHIVLINSFI